MAQIKKSTQSKVVDINEKKATEELRWRNEWKEQQKEEVGWLPSDAELWGKIQVVIHAADKYRGLVESRPFECGYPEAGADSVHVAGLDFHNLTASLDPMIEGYHKRAYKAAAEKGCRCGDDFSNSRFAGEVAGFNIGVIFGARMAGYSDEQMARLGKGLFNAITVTSRYLQRGTL